MAGMWILLNINYALIWREYLYKEIEWKERILCELHNA